MYKINTCSNRTHTSILQNNFKNVKRCRDGKLNVCEAYVIPFLFGSFFTVCHPYIDVYFLKCFFCYFYKLGHAGIRSCNDIEVRLHYDQISGDFTSTAAFLSLLPWFSNFSRKVRPTRTINNTYLVPTSTKEN